MQTLPHETKKSRAHEQAMLSNALMDLTFPIYGVKSVYNIIGC